MSIETYISDKEQVVAEAEIRGDSESMFGDSENLIACTQHRIVILQGKEVIDVTHKRIDSVVYELPSISLLYVGSGLVSLLVAGVSYFIPSDPIVQFLLVAFFGLVGLVLLGAAFWTRSTALQINTPSKSFTVYSSNQALDNVANVLRRRQ